MKNKRGIITISENHFRDIDASSKYLLEVFKEFIPLKCDFDWNGRLFHGYHPAFDEIPESHVAPFYTVNVTEEYSFIGEKEYKIVFERV